MAAVGNARDVTVPDIGDFVDVPVIEILVEPGQHVAAEDPLVVLESDKATMEVPAPFAGVVADVKVKLGDRVSEGATLLVLDVAGENGASAPKPPEPSMPRPDRPSAEAGAPRSVESAIAAEVQSGEHAPPPPQPPAPTPGEVPVYASPGVRRLARERGIDLASLHGTGPQGRIVRRDLDGWTPPAIAPAEAAASVPSAAGSAQAAPAQPDAGFVDVPHTGMRRAIARRLTESTSTVPDFQLVAHCRVDELLALRARVNEQSEVKISVNDFVLKAVARAMRDVPEANAVWTDDATRRFTGVDIAVAVSVAAGLVTPVVRGVDRLSLTELSATVREMAERAREGRLKQHELEGGSFSVSNLGMYGIEEFSAIINPPHSGILAVGAATKRPVVDEEGALAVATVMTVTLSADHRVLDGALAAQWLAAFVRRIENPLSVLI